MALVTRLTRLFQADFHAVLDRIEEPDLQLRQAVREMQYALDHDQQRQQLLQHEAEQLNKTALTLGDRLQKTLKKMPEGEAPPPARDCYRFALSHPAVSLVLCGPANREQMQEAVRALDAGPLDADETARMRRIGDHVYGRYKPQFGEKGDEATHHLRNTLDALLAGEKLEPREDKPPQ